MSNNINNDLFQAIDTIIAKRLEQVVFDEIIQCKIVKRIAENSNEYQVENNSVIYTAIAKDNEEYKENDNVCVSVLKNSNEKIILGKYTLSKEDALAYEDPFRHFVRDVGFDIISESGPWIELGQTTPTKSEQIYSTNENWVATTLEGYDFMGLEIGVDISDNLNTTGDWAISVALLDKLGNPIHKLEQVDDNLSISPYLIASDEIYGNPYNLASNFKHRKLFHFPASVQLSNVQSVQVILYQSGNFKYNATLTVSHLQLLFGYDVNKYLTHPIHLYISGQYDGNFVYGNDITENKPDISALIIDQESKTIVTELKENQELRWYQYIIGEKGDEIGGGYWDYIEISPEDVKNNPLTLPFKYYDFQPKRLSTQIKAILCEKKTVTNFNTNKSLLLKYEIKDSPEEPQQPDEIEGKEPEENNLLIRYPTEDGAGYRYAYWQPQASDSLKWKVNQHWEKENGEIAWLTNNGDNYEYSAWVQYINGINEPPIINYYHKVDKKEETWESIGSVDSELNTPQIMAIAKSEPLIFTNESKEEDIDGDGIIAIVATLADRSIPTHWLLYNNLKIIPPSPQIQLKLVRTDGQAWESMGGEPEVVEWSINSGGLLTGIELPNSTGKMTNTITITKNDNINTLTPINLTLADEFDRQKGLAVNNVITCRIPGMQAKLNMSFGELSTQGTNYSFRIEPINNQYAIVNAQGSTQQFKAILTTSDGIELTDYTVEWSLTQTGQGNHFSWHGLDDNNKNHNVELILEVPYEDLSNHKAILEAECDVKALHYAGNSTEVQTVTLVAKHPIAIIHENLESSFKKAEGIFELQWDNTEQLLTSLAEPTYYNLLPNKDQEYIWSIQGSNGQSGLPVIKSTDDHKYYLDYNDNEQSQQPYFQSRNISVCASDNNNSVVFVQPFMTTIARYPIDMANRWAGGAVWINENKEDKDAGSIMAVQFGAGKKNLKDSSFTGVFMGDIKFNDRSQTMVGLFGINNGVRTFSIDAETGNAYFKGSIDATSLYVGNALNYIHYDNINGFEIKTQYLYGDSFYNSDNSSLYFRYVLGDFQNFNVSLPNRDIEHQGIWLSKNSEWLSGIANVNLTITMDIGQAYSNTQFTWFSNTPPTTETNNQKAKFNMYTVHGYGSSNGWSFNFNNDMPILEILNETYRDEDKNTTKSFVAIHGPLLFDHYPPGQSYRSGCYYGLRSTQDNDGIEIIKMDNMLNITTIQRLI